MSAQEPATTCPTCYAEVLTANLEGHLIWHRHIDRCFDTLTMSRRELKRKLAAGVQS